MDQTYNDPHTSMHMYNDPYTSMHMYNVMSPLSHCTLTNSHSQSTSYLDEDIGEWSLGESIMRTLSRGDIHLFDIDNPQHERYVWNALMLGIGML